jgi:hypothetical protein
MGTRRPAALLSSAVTTPQARSAKRRTLRFHLETEARWKQSACGRKICCCCERRAAAVGIVRPLSQRLLCARGVLARRSAVRFAAVTDIGARDGDRRTIPDRLGDEMARGAPPVAEVVCTAIGLMEGFEGDCGGQHERTRRRPARGASRFSWWWRSHASCRPGRSDRDSCALPLPIKSQP